MSCCSSSKSDKGCQKTVGKRKVKTQVPSISSLTTKTNSESSVAVSKDESTDDDVPAPSVPSCSCSTQTEEFQDKIALANAMALEKKNKKETKDQGCDAGDPCESPAPCATDDSEVGDCCGDKELKLKELMMEKALHFLSCNVIQGLNELGKIELAAMMAKTVSRTESPGYSTTVKLDKTPVLKRLGESLNFIEQQELKSVLFLKEIQRKRWLDTIEAMAPDLTGCCMTKSP